MKYLILDTNNGWFKAFEGSEDEAIKETERLSAVSDRRHSLHDDMGHLVGGTYIPEPVYVFLKG